MYFPDREVRPLCHLYGYATGYRPLYVSYLRRHPVPLRRRWRERWRWWRSSSSSPGVDVASSLLHRPQHPCSDSNCPAARTLISLTALPHQLNYFIYLFNTFTVCTKYTKCQTNDSPVEYNCKISRQKTALTDTVKHTQTVSSAERVPELIPVLDSRQVTWIINPAVGCHYFPPGLQLPSQPLRGLLPILLLGEQGHNGCEQFA